LENLKEKAQTGISLGFVTQISTQAAQFIFGLILARLLTPQDYGLTGMLAIFISMSDVFIDSGFGTAVMRKKSPEDSDYSTVFWFNFLVSIIVYIILFLLAPAISGFYGDERLILLTRVICIVVIVNAFGSIQGKYLNKNMQYKKLTKVYMVAFLGSSVFAVLMAAAGFGVWSLVGKTIILALLLNGGWWMVSSWKPKRIFSIRSFKELGSFGSKILATSIFSSFFSNVYSVIIGKLFNAQSLGYFTRARQFFELPEKNIKSSSMNVFFPALSYMQDDNTRLLNTYNKIIGVYAFVLFPIYALISIIAKPLILVILTDKWLESVILLQYFCLLAIALPFESVNENLLYVKGRSDFVFFITVLKKVGLVIFLLLFYKTGLKGIVWAFVLEGYLGVILSTLFAKKTIEFSFIKQIKQVLPSIGLTMAASLLMLLGMGMTETGIFQLFFVPTLGIIIYLVISYLTKRPELNEIIDIITGMNRRLKKQE
jgi:O-antigen/teichoic acid export membrane protein